MQLSKKTDYLIYQSLELLDIELKVEDFTNIDEYEHWKDELRKHIDRIENEVSELRKQNKHEFTQSLLDRAFSLQQILIRNLFEPPYLLIRNL